MAAVKVRDIIRRLIVSLASENKGALPQKCRYTRHRIVKFY